jgi:predicted dithiol-disulfide oxidoreductase (DUF899 family)
MTPVTIKGTFRHTNLSNESEEYRAKREELRLAEVALMTQMERVSEMRRHLPSGPPLEDYEFEEGPRDLDSGDAPIQRVRLSDLFTAPDRALIVYHMMFGKLHKGPCPMCTSFVDALNGIAGHLEQKVDLAIVVAADPATFRAHARSRGWNHLRLLSAGESAFKYDLASEDRAGNQDSTISVLTLGNDGIPRHFYTAHPRLSPDLKERGLDLLNPIWNFLDLTPNGREDFVAKLQYPPNSLTKNGHTQVKTGRPQ